MPAKAKVKLTSHGSLWLFTPLTRSAAAFLRNHTAPETQFWGEAVVVEPRYVVGFHDFLDDNGVVCTACVANDGRAGRLQRAQ